MLDKELEFYIKTGKFDENQIAQIKLGLEHGIDVFPYANPEYSPKQMDELRSGLELEFYSKIKDKLLYIADKNARAEDEGLENEEDFNSCYHFISKILINDFNLNENIISLPFDEFNLPDGIYNLDTDICSDIELTETETLHEIMTEFYVSSYNLFLYEPNKYEEILYGKESVKKGRDR